MANAIFKGIKGYFQKTPPPGSYLAAVKNKDRSLHRYTITSGDTLSVIAQKYDTTMTNLKKLNGLKTSRLRIGQVLKVPAS